MTSHEYIYNSTKKEQKVVLRLPFQYYCLLTTVVRRQIVSFRNTGEAAKKRAVSQHCEIFEDGGSSKSIKY